MSDGVIDAHYEPMEDAATKIYHIVERIEDMIQTMNNTLNSSVQWDAGSKEVFNVLQQSMTQKVFQLNYWSSAAAQHVIDSATTLQDTDARLSRMLGNVPMGGQTVYGS
jgi:uncharacterized protein YukE